MNAFDVVLLAIIGGAVFGAIRYIILKKKSGGCVGCSGCSGCSTACRTRSGCCGSDNIDSSSIHIKRSAL